MHLPEIKKPNNTQQGNQKPNSKNFFRDTLKLTKNYFSVNKSADMNVIKTYLFNMYKL